nr:immunoglobulin light chain junction region [Macaca mulatta]
CQQSNSLPYSF